MMMTIIPPAERRRRARGRLLLTVLAAVGGFYGGASAASDSLWEQLRGVPAGDIARAFARRTADGLYVLSGVSPAGAPPAAPAPSAKPSAVSPPGLQVQVTETWAAPGGCAPMPDGAAAAL